MLVRLLIVALLVAAVAWLVTRRARVAARRGAGAARPLVQDPVCKTFVPKETAVVVRRGDEDFYFCGRECAERFERAEH